MNRETLEIFLPAFMIVFFGLISFWTKFRKRPKVELHVSKTEVYKKVHLIDTVFKIMLISSILIVFIYTYFPDYYIIFAPIDFLDHPIINTIGVLILKVSLAWLVIAQLTIDKSAFMIKTGIEVWNHNRLILYSEKLLLSGMLVMFFGFFVTISSIGSILICIIGLLLFDRLLRYQ
ncbi:MAG: hypothetical protein KF687_14425 [Cyclobacteriaceae bacterium]|nr:hypothetical protein [Cyclobacteriaceae bacterium]